MRACGVFFISLIFKAGFIASGPLLGSLLLVQLVSHERAYKSACDMREI